MELRVGLSDLQASSRKLVQSRIRLADRFANAYDDMVRLSIATRTTEESDVSEACSDEAQYPDLASRLECTRARDIAGTFATGGLRSLLPDYNNTLLNIQAGIDDSIQNALSELDMHSDNQDTDQHLNNALAEFLYAVNGLGSLAQPTGTDFENTITSSWDGVVAYLNSIDTRALASAERQRDNLLLSMGELSRELIRLEQQGYEIVDSAEADLQVGIEVLESDNPLGVADSIGGMVNANLFALGIDPAGEANILKATNTFSLMNSQLERLQDPADPAWRILTDEDNEDKWNNDATTTGYYAEGDSSVVIVRDNPTTYRVQFADNDPTVLIESQLVVSRAVTNAAIAIAGGALGVEDLLPAPGGTTVNGQPTDTGLTEAEKIATSQASLSSERQLRTNVARQMNVSLTQFRQQADDSLNTAQSRSLADRMISQLNAYKTILEQLNASQSQ